MSKGKLIVIISLLSLFLLAACSDKTGGIEIPEDAVVINFWNPDVTGWQPTYQQLIDEFNGSQSEIFVVMSNFPEDGFMEKLNVSFAAGEGPDVWPWYYSIDNYELGHIQNLDDFIAADNWNMDQYFQPITSLRAMGSDGSYYGLPRDISMTVMLYNKDLFDEREVDYPEEGWTWEDFRAIAAKITDEENDIYGTDIVGNIWSWLLTAPTAWTAGSDILSEDGMSAVGYLDSEEIISLTSTMQNIVLDGSNIPPAFAETLGSYEMMFASGYLGMTVGSLWGFDLIEELEFEWGSIAFPGDGLYGWSDVVSYHMNSDSKNKAAAWEFMKFMSSAKASDIIFDTFTWGPPVVQSWIDAGYADDPRMQTYFNEGSKDSRVPIYLRHSSFWDASQPLFDAIASILDPYDGVYAEPERTLKEAAQQMQDILDNYDQGNSSKDENESSD